MHYQFTNQIHRRSSDGIHWNPDAVRMQVPKKKKKPWNPSPPNIVLYYVPNQYWHH